MKNFFLKMTVRGTCISAAFLFSCLVAFGQITVTTTNPSDCKNTNGTATINVTTAATGFNFEYSTDGNTFENSNKFNNLEAGTYTATVRDIATKCSYSKEFIINRNPQLTVGFSALPPLGICGEEPKELILFAYASGGSGRYEFKPAETITLYGSASVSFTVTDLISGCSASIGGEVIHIPVQCSHDPNDIVGPEGFGAAKMVSKYQPQPYIIRFENDPGFATAPAQIVRINYPIDSSLNVLSLRLGNFGFGKFTFQVPPNKTHYSSRLDVRDSLGVVVDITAGIDLEKKEAFWIFESKDPATGLPPANSQSGFLPVNDSSAVGEGYVTFTVKAADNTITGDTIHAQASIVFDANTPLATPSIINTIDAGRPVSTMESLPVTSDSTILLKWSGYDEENGSGIRDYALYVSENEKPFSIYQSGITDTSFIFRRSTGYNYRFFTIATDNTGNQEPVKNKGEVTVVSPGNEYYRSIMTGNWNNISTWQSSVDSINWIAASIIPTNAARNITIRRTDSIVVINDLTTDNTVVEPGGTLSVAAGSTLTVINNGLILRSNADSSASIGVSGGSINGNVTVERFIPARRSWRLVAVPFSTAQTISDAWQEAGIYIPGFGTHITGGSAANGFDQSPANTSSIKWYNQSTNAFDSMPSTLLPLTGKTGYMLFVGGDRSIDLSQGTAAMPTNTILRATGTVKMGIQPPIPVSATGFTLVGNPYASTIDFAKISKANVPNRFYLWDPKRSTTGAFVLFDSADSYVPITNGGSYTGANSLIQSGQAFFAEGSGMAGTLGISENSKSDEQRNAFRTNDGNDEKMQVNLNFYDADTTIVADAVLTRYNNLYSDSVTAEDAGKPDNIDENLAIIRNEKKLMLERRILIDENDTTFLKIYNMKQKDYHFQVTPTHFIAPAFSAYLEDAWLKTATPLSLEAPSTIRFAITNDSASANPYRFRIIFTTGSGPLPLNFATVNAYRKNSGIKVDWNVESEFDIKQYEVQKSGNGQLFRQVTAVPPVANNNGAADYSWFDSDPFTGDNFYRVRATLKSNEVKYSEIVNVNIGDVNPGILIYPNPVKDKTFFVKLTNQPKGIYVVKLFNNSGQLVITKKIEHTGGSIIRRIQLNSVLSKGTYLFNVTNGKTRATKSIMID